MKDNYFTRKNLFLDVLNSCIFLEKILDYESLIGWKLLSEWLPINELRNHRYKKTDYFILQELKWEEVVENLKSL